MKEADLCPCGCEREVPRPTGLGDTPFVSDGEKKTFLARHECREAYITAKLSAEVTVIHLPKIPL